MLSLNLVDLSPSSDAVTLPNSKGYFPPIFEPSLYLVEKMGIGSFLMTLRSKSSVQTGICSVCRTSHITGNLSPSGSDSAEGSKCTPSYSSSYVADRNTHLCKTGPPDQAHTNSTGSTSPGPFNHGRKALSLAVASVNATRL